MGDNEITIYRGDTRTINLTVTENGSAKDITGGTLLFTVKSNPTLPDASSSIQVSGSILSGPDGTATFSLSSSNTNISAGNYKYDIQLTTLAGNKYTVVSDNFVVLEDVTKT